MVALGEDTEIMFRTLVPYMKLAVLPVISFAIVGFNSRAEQTVSPTQLLRMQFKNGTEHEIPSAKNGCSKYRSITALAQCDPRPAGLTGKYTPGSALGDRSPGTPWSSWHHSILSM